MHFFLRSLLILLLLSGCRGLPSEPQSAARQERPWGLAGGQSEEEAQRLAGMVEHILPAYRGLEGFIERPLRAHMTGSLGGAHLAGVTVEPLVGDPWVAVNREAQDLELALAHELAHFYFQEQQLRFPSIIEEGMCELLSGLAYDASDFYRRRLTLAGVAYLDQLEFRVTDPRGKLSVDALRAAAPDIEDALAMNWSQLFRADRATAVTCYGLGSFLARRIGWEGLLRLVRRADRDEHAKVPIPWILDAAGIQDPYQVSLRAALIEGLDLGHLSGVRTQSDPSGLAD